MHDLRDAGVILALSCSDLDDLNILQITQLPIDEIILSDDLVEDITNDRKKNSNAWVLLLSCLRDSKLMSLPKTFQQSHNLRL